MSRYVSKPHNGKTLAFGFDHVLGYFVEQWDISAPDKSLVELNSKFDKLSKSFLVEFLQNNLSPNDLVKYSSQINKIVLDLPC